MSSNAITRFARTLASTWTWTVGEALEARADVALLEAIGQGAGEWSGPRVSASRSSLKKLFEDGSATSDGVPIKANAKLKSGARVRLDFPAPPPSEIRPEARELEVLFEDDHLLVINKPAGLTVHPSPTMLEGTLVGALLHRGGALSSVGGPMRPGIVHRLDKDTSGALVVSKTDECHRKLTEVFSRHAIDRTYWALCYGVPESKEGSIKSTLGRNPADRKKMAMNVKGGRDALTLYKRLEAYGTLKAKPFASWLELTLHTGRTHQIRVHLTGLACSVLGDPVYGTPSSKQQKWVALPEAVREAIGKLPGQALHARTIGFEHPMTGKKISLTAEPPADFQALLGALKKFA